MEFRLRKQYYGERQIKLGENDSAAVTDDSVSSDVVVDTETSMDKRVQLTNKVCLEIHMQLL